MCVYLELVFDLAGVGLGVQPADVVVDGSELTHWDGGVPTQTRLQDGVVNKHVLFLEQEQNLAETAQTNTGTTSPSTTGQQLCTCPPSQDRCPSHVLVVIKVHSSAGQR